MSILVHTVNARDNILLEFLQDRFQLTNVQAGRLIVESATTTTRALAARGVSYADLRGALTPSLDRSEVGLLFDIESVGAVWYGRPIYSAVLPLLDKVGSHSVLSGDILTYRGDFESQLAIHLRPRDPRQPPIGRTTLFCVYINNCSQSAIAKLHEGLSRYLPYAGYVDVTFSSRLKTLLSLTLVSSFIYHRGVVVQRHEDLSAADLNQNTLGLPCEEIGLACRSIEDSYFGLLLSYKIERSAMPDDERDRVFSLSSVSDHATDIADSIIEIEDAKYDYLETKKFGSLKRLGIHGASKESLEHQIRSKLRSSYLYHLRFNPEHSFSGFNILLDLEAADTGEPVRAVAAFAYEAERNTIRLVTLY